MIFKRAKVFIFLFLFFGAVLSTGSFAWALDADELPTEGEIVSGEGSFDIDQSQMTVHQRTDNMIAEWASFNIGKDASVTFRQPDSSSKALNRISDANPSQIFGRLSANGKIFLLNTNGFIFGPSARVNVGGLVASSLNISNEDFLADNYIFENSGGAGSVHNAADIAADEYGYVAFISPDIHNTGRISVPSGTAALVAGDKVSLDFNGDQLINFIVDAGAVDAMIENGGIVQASGGLVMMKAEAAGALKESVINISGIVEAQSMREHQGRIVLDAGEYGQSTVSGTLDVSSETAQAGRITVTGNKVLIDEGAQLSAEGETGGGEIFIGGGWQGGDPSIRNATGTVILENALLDASAMDSGDGGTIVAWSDVDNDTSVTRVYGTLLAKGGINGGNGGRIETSGHWVGVGIAPNVFASAGIAGEWLIDPYNITVSDIADGTSSNINTDASPFTSSGDSASLDIDVIDGALETGNVSLVTGSGGSQAGDIRWNVDYDFSGADARILTLSAHRDILLNQSITSSNGALSMQFTADSDSNSSGGIVVEDDLTTQGGSITFDGLGTIFSGSSAQSINTSGGAGGNIDFNGEVLLANTSGVTITTGGGNIAFDSLVNSGNSYTYESTESTWQAAMDTTVDGGYTSGDGTGDGDTYLATVTSALENTAIMAVAGGNEAWLGGSDQTTEGTWQWVAGPENGTTFWTTSQSQGATGYNGYDEAYVNWNGGEPNDAGDSEDALQLGAGTTGEWNDLPADSIDKELGSIVETNLAASPLTVNAGAGTVTFSGAVGGTKSLSSLDVTAGTVAIDGGVVITEGLQTYTGDVTLGAADTTLTQTVADTDFTLQSSKSVTNDYDADAGLTIQTTRDIIMEDSSVISSETGALDVVLRSDSDADGGAIFMKPDSGISSNGGDITLSGGADVSTGYAFGRDSVAGLSNGILIAGASITSDGGNIIMRGKGAAVPGDISAAGLHADFSSNNAFGIYIANNGATDATMNSGTGTINLAGVGIATNLGDSSFSHGIQIGASSSGSTTVTSANTTSTAITVTGDAGTATGSASATDGAVGIQLYTNSDVSATGTSGGIVIDGTGGDNADLQWAWGYNSAADSALSAEGLISITGTGQGGSNREDISLAGGTIGDASHSGGITLNMDTLGSSLGTILSNAGALTVKPRSTGTSIGIAGGAGTLALTADNFSTNFVNGFSNIIVGSATAGAVSLAGAMSFNDNIELISASTISNTGTLTLNDSSLLKVNAGAASSFSGTVAGVDGSFETTGSAITLSTENTFTGSTTIGDASGLTLTHTNALSASSGVVNNGTLDISGSGGASLVSLSGSGTVSLGAQTLTLTNNSGEVSGAVSGTGGLQLDAGDLTLSGNNTYSGTTTVAGGSLTAKHNNALGAAAASAVVSDGASLIFDGSSEDLSITLAALTLSGTGVGGNGALRNLAGNNRVDVPITLSESDVLFSADAGDFTFGGTIDQPYGLTVNSQQNVTFEGEIGGTLPVKFLTTDSGGTTAIEADVTTIGQQTYNDGLTLTGSRVLTAANSENYFLPAITEGLDADAYSFSEGTGMANEEPDKAFDGDVNTKYFNWATSDADILIEGETPYVVTVLGLTTANDMPDRDPTSFTLYGSNISTAEGMVEISSGDLNPPDERLTSYDQVVFENNTSYQYYRLVFNTKRDPDTAATQIAEVRLTTGLMPSVDQTSSNVVIGAATTTDSGLEISSYGSTDINASLTVDQNLVVDSTLASDIAGEISAGGTIDISTVSGNLTISDSVSTTDSTDSAIKLNAGKDTAAGTSTGGNIIISGGSVSVGDGGRGTLYSGDVSDSIGLTDLVGSGSGNFRYNSDESDSNFTDTLGAGTYAVYREQPVLSVAPESNTVTYGDAVSFTTDYSGYVNGDLTPGTVTGTAVWTVGGSKSTSGNYTVGAHDVSYNSGLTSGLGYGFTDNARSTNELTVNPYTLNLSGFTADNKTYDGTTSVTGTGFNDDRIGSDELSFGYTAEFADKNAGTDKAVNYTDISISGGADQGNYDLASSTGSATADIMKAGLTITARDDSKIYDGLAYSGGNGATYAGFASGEDQNVLGGSLDYSGTSQGAIQVGDYTIIPQGFSSDNYSLAFSPGALEITVDTNDQKIDEVVRSLTSITKSVNGTQDSLSGTHSVPSNNFSIGPGTGSRSIRAFVIFELIKDLRL
jgi:filamentous hemagglutinin family protein